MTTQGGNACCYKLPGFVWQLSMDRDAKWLAWFEQQFSMMAGSDRQIDLDEFKQALNVKQVWHSKAYNPHYSLLAPLSSLAAQSFFAERFFHLFDKDNSGTISLKELMDGLTLLTHGTEVDKLQFLFQVYDVDGQFKTSVVVAQGTYTIVIAAGNGHIDFHELRTVLKSCMNESALKFSDDKLDELTRLVPASYPSSPADGLGYLVGRFIIIMLYY